MQQRRASPDWGGISLFTMPSIRRGRRGSTSYFFTSERQALTSFLATYISVCSKHIRSIVDYSSFTYLSLKLIHVQSADRSCAFPQFLSPLPLFGNQYLLLVVLNPRVVIPICNSNFQYWKAKPTIYSFYRRFTTYHKTKAGGIRWSRRHSACLLKCITHFSDSKRKD